MSVFDDIAIRNRSEAFRTDYAKDIDSIEYKGYDTSKQWEFRVKEYEDTRSVLRQLYMNSDDPDSEVDKTFVGNIIHSLYPSISAEYARENASDIIFRATGRKPETKNLLDLFGQSFTSSMASMNAGLRLANFYIFNDPNATDKEYFEQQKEELMKDLSAYKTDYNRETYEKYGSLVSKIVAETGNLLPTSIPSMAAGFIGTMIGGPAAAGGILSAIATKASGRALLGAAITSGISSLSSAMQEIGSIALDMEEYGIDSDIIRSTAIIGGAIAGAFEPISDSAMGKMMAPINRFISNFGKDAASIAFKETVKSLAKEYGKSALGSLIKEPITEILQTIPEMMAVDFAANLMKGRYSDYDLFEGYSKDDYIQAFKDTFIATFQGTIGSSILHTGLGFALNARSLSINSRAGKYTKADGANNIARVKDIKTDNKTTPNKNFKASDVDPIKVVRIGDKYIPINPSSTQKEVLANNPNGFVFITDVGSKAKGNSTINLNYKMSIQTINKSIEDAYANGKIQGFTYLDGNGRETSNSSDAKRVLISTDGNEILSVNVSDNNESKVSDFENDVFGQTFTKFTEKEEANPASSDNSGSTVFDNIKETKDNNEYDNKADNDTKESSDASEANTDKEETLTEEGQEKEDIESSRKETAKRAEEALKKAGIADENTDTEDAKSKINTQKQEANANKTADAKNDVKTDTSMQSQNNNTVSTEQTSDEKKLEERRKRLSDKRANDSRFSSAIHSINNDADINEVNNAVNTFSDILYESAKNADKKSKTPRTDAQIENSARISALVALGFSKAQGKTVTEFINSFNISNKANDKANVQGWIEGNNIYISDNTSPLTISHELAHHFLNTLDKNSDMYKEIERVYGKTDLKEGIGEAFSQGLERYIEGEKSANKILNGIFEELKKLCKSILNYRKAHNVIDRNNRAFFDSIFAPEERVSEKAKQKQSEIISESESNRKMASATDKIISDNKNTADKGEEADGSKTAVREGLSDGGRDGISSNNEREISDREVPDGAGMAKAVSEGIRVAKGDDTGSDIRHNRAILLDKQLSKIKSDAHAVEFHQIESNEANATKFKAAIDNARETQPFGLYVDSYEINTTKDENGYESLGYSDPRIKLFMSDDESIGFAIKEDGDIVSVFADKTKGNHPMSVYSILLSAIENGGNRLDCYGKGLLKFYMRMGFVPQGKVLYNEEYESAEWKARKDVLKSPDVYALYWGDSSADETVNKLSERFESINDKTVSEISDNLPVYEDVTITEKDGKKLESPVTEYGYDRLMEARDKAYDAIVNSRKTVPSTTGKSASIVSDKVTPENTKEVASKVADAIVKKSGQKKESKTIRIEEKAQNLDVNKIEQDKKQSKSGNLMDIDATRNFDSNEINRRENDFNRYIIREVDKDSPQINFIKNGFLKPSANLDKLLAVVSQLAYNGKVISNRDMDIFRTSGGGLAIRMNAVLDSNGEEIRAKSESSAPWIYIPGQPTGNYVDMTTTKAFASSSDTNTVRGTAIAFAINRDRNSLIEKINDMNTPDSILKRTDDKLKKERESATTAVADTASSDGIDTLDYYYEPDNADKSKLKNKRVERISIKSKEVADLKKELNDNRKNIYGFDFGDSYSYMFNENDFYKFQSTPVAKAINLLANTDAFNSDNIEVYGDDQGNIIIKSNVELRTADTDEMETVSRKLDNPKYTFIPATQYEGLGQMSDIASLYEDNDLEMPYIKRFNDKEDPKHENPIIENFFNDIDGDYEFNVEMSNKYEYYPGIIAEGYLNNITSEVDYKATNETQYSLDEDSKPVFYSIAEESGSEEAMQKASDLVANIIIDSLSQKELASLVKDGFENNEKIKKYLRLFNEEQKSHIIEALKRDADYAFNSYSAVGRRLAKMLTNEHEKAKARNELISITKKAIENASSITDLKNNICRTITGQGSSEIQTMFKNFVDACVSDSKAVSNDEAVRQIIQWAVEKDGTLKFNTVDRNKNKSNLLTKLLNFAYSTEKSSDAETKVDSGYYEASNSILRESGEYDASSSYISISDLASKLINMDGDGSFLNSVFDGAITGNLTKSIADGLYAKINTNESQIDKNNQKIISLSNEIDKLNDEYAKLSDKHDDSKQHIDDLKTQIEKDAKKIKAQNDKIQARDEKIEDLKKSMRELAKQNNTLKAEISNIINSEEYQKLQTVDNEYRKLFKIMKENPNSRDSRAVKVMKSALDSIDSNKSGTPIDLKAFTPRWEGYNDALVDFVSSLVKTGIISKNQNDVWILNKNLKDCTLAELGSIIDAENKFFSETDKAMRERNKAYKKALANDKQAIIDDIARFYKLQNSNGEFAEAINDFFKSVDQTSKEEKDKNRSKLLKSTEIELMSNMLKRECPALYSYMFGGYINYKETDENGTRTVRKYIFDNINTATDKEKSNTMRRKNAFNKKISELFDVKEGKVSNASARLFSNDLFKTGSVDISEYDGNRNIKLVSVDDMGIYEVANNLNESYVPIAEYMAYQYQKNAERLQNLKDMIESKNISDEEKATLFETEKEEKGIKTKEELDAIFSADGIQSGYSMSQLMGIYMYSKQKDGIYDMLTGSDYALNTNNLTVGNIISVIDKFENDDSFRPYKELADFMLADMESRYDDMADVYYLLKNKVLTKIPNYFMIRGELDFYNYGIGMEGNPIISSKVKDNPTKDRTSLKHALNLDVMSLYTKGIEEQEHYIAFAKLADKYDKVVFGNGSTADQSIAKAYITAAEQAGHKKPQEVINSLNNWWDIVKEPGRFAGDSTPILGMVRNNMAVSVLWGNISTVLQQFPTYVLTLSKVGFNDFFNTLGKVMAHPKAYEDLVYSKSTQMRDRARLDTDVYRQQMSDPNSIVNKMFRGNGAKISEMYKDFISMGLKPMEAVDKWVANASWLAVYEWNIKNLEQANGITDEQFDIICAQNATQFVMDTNSSRNAKDNALIYSKRDSALKSMLLFTSQLNKQFNMIYGSILDYKNNKDLGANISDVIRNVAVIGLAALGAVVTSGAIVPDDDDAGIDEWLLNTIRESLLEYIGMVPFVGDSIKSIIRGDYFADSNVTETTINAGKVIGRKISGDRKLKDSTFRNAIAKELAQIAELVGLPSTQPMKIYRAIRDENALDVLSTNWGKVLE